MSLIFTSPKPLRIIWAVIGVLMIAAIPMIMVPGLTQAEAVQPYLNNVFPASLSGSGTTVLEIGPYKSGMSFNTVMDMAQAPGSNRLYVVERSGNIYSFDKGMANPEKQLFRNMRNMVWDGQDSGILGLAFHPDFNKAGSPNSNFLYLFYVTEVGGVRHIRISRLTRNIADETYVEGSELILIDQKINFTSTNLHRGGALVFGDDGFLYISIGDLGVPTQSQNMTDRLCGGILRIDVDRRGGNISHPIQRSLQQFDRGTTANYYIPNDNPWVNPNGSVFEEYYAIGCRNPHKMSKDRATGTMYIGNVGSNSGNKKEEINVVSKGANFGWPFREGNADRPDLMERPNPMLGTIKDPLVFYEHGGAGNCVIGGFVYRGTTHPELVGKYIFGDYGSKNIWSVNLDGSGQNLISTLGANFPTFGQDTDGEIYIGQMGTKSLLKLSANKQFVVPDGLYYVRSKHSGKVLDIASKSAANGGNIHQWPEANTTSQQWYLEKLTANIYRIKSNHSGKYLEAAAFGTQNGTNVQQWTWTGTNSQQWALEQGDQGHFFFRNLHNNKYLDVSGVSLADGANIHLWTRHGGNNQQWELLAIDGPAINPPLYLSQTGAFSNLANLTPASGVIPYTVNTPLWSDGAAKKRWVVIPNDGNFNTAAEKVNFNTRSDWKFPEGTVFIKHFELALDERNPNNAHRLETRFIIIGPQEKYYGLTYKWNSTGTDAVLLSDGVLENFQITDQRGQSRSLTWQYPSRSECLTCHTQASGGVLGPQTSQLNGTLTYGSTGITANQLETWQHLGIFAYPEKFSKPVDPIEITRYITSRSLDDQRASLEQRARSYLDANCSGCHRPNGGPRSEFDARIGSGLDLQNLINGPVIENLGIAGAKLIVPGSPEKSIIYQRINQANTGDAMPPLAKSRVDEVAADLILGWINALPASGGGWNAKYYSDRAFNTLSFERIDRAVDFFWDVVPPKEGFKRTEFSVSWTTTLTTRFSETYTFSLMGDDGVRMWVDGQLVVNDWSVHPPRESSGNIFLAAGKHQVKVEYFQAGGNARIELYWESSSQARELIPAMYTDPALEVVQPNEAPTASFTTNVESGPAPLAVQFDATASIDPEGNPMTYNWDFGDGNIGTGLKVSHNYQTIGSYTAKLTVTDEEGLTDEDMKVITVNQGGGNGEPQTLKVLADAHTNNASITLNQNYGSKGFMEARNKISWGYTSYLKFDLKSLTSVNQAKLRVYGVNPRSNLPVNIQVSGTTDGWTEMGITANNAPAKGEVVGTFLVSGSATYYEIDVTAYIQAELSNDQMASFVIAATNVDNERARFNTKEKGTFIPELVVVGDAPNARNRISGGFTTELNGSLNVYPNPFSDQLTVKYIGEISEGVTIRLMDMLGKLIFEEEGVFADRTLVISFPNGSGVYLLQVIYRGNVIESRKVVQSDY